MDQEKLKEYNELYEDHKKTRGKLPTEIDVQFELINMYIKSTSKRDKKRSAKLILKSKAKLMESGLWQYLNEGELNNA